MSLRTWARGPLESPPNPSRTRGGAFASSYVEQTSFDAKRSTTGDLEVYFDSNLEGPGIWKWRHYFPIYERHLARFRNRPVDLVEVGIYSGGSLSMWRSYLGAQARIYGIDVEPACKTYETPDMRVFIGDQADPAFWNAFLAEVPEFDIVIDDGGHETRQQIPTLEAVLPHLRPGGVYLCEDIHTQSNAFHDYIEGLERELHATGESYRFATTPWQSSIDSIHVYPFVTVIEKRTSPLDVHEAPRHGTQWQPFYDGSTTVALPSTSANIDR
jgi:Methyltransferase domain